MCCFNGCCWPPSTFIILWADVRPHSLPSLYVCVYFTLLLLCMLKVRHNSCDVRFPVRNLFLVPFFRVLLLLLSSFLDIFMRLPSSLFPSFLLSLSLSLQIGLCVVYMRCVCICVRCVIHSTYRLFMRSSISSSLFLSHWWAFFLFLVFGYIHGSQIV